MNNAKKIWVVEAHDLGALQVRAAGDAVAINRKRWMEGNVERGKKNVECKTEDRTGKADRMLVGIADTIDGALEVERELKRMRRQTVAEGVKDVMHEE